MRLRFLHALFLLTLSASVLLAQKPEADLILTNAKIHTMDAAHPLAEAVAVLRDKIVAVGSNAEIALWRGSKTKVIDAARYLVLPGFNDAHVHFFDGSAQLEQVELKDAHSPAEFARRIGEQAKKTPKGEWVRGGEWDDQAFEHPELPTKQMIDPVTPGTPVFVSRYDGHMSLANSLALKLAGVTAQTPDPVGGVIVRDAKGEPTGILKDSAMNLVDRVIPALSREQNLRLLREGIKYAASVGVTSVQHMNPLDSELAAEMELDRRGELTVRFYAAPMETNWANQAALGIQHGFGSPYLRLGVVKGYADGSLGSSTAAFFEPFTDAPDSHGILSDEMVPLSAIRERFIEADAAGLQLCIHAIGDQGISQVLDLFEEVEKANGKKDRRWRIEHAQHMAQKDFDRMARLGVIASVQPYHAIDDGRWAEKRIGHDRSSRTYAFRTFLDHHVPLALGTDWTVAPLDPLQTIYAAVTRATLDGKKAKGWFPEQKLTVQEAVSAYTMGSAFAEFQENVKGSITVGKYADLVMLSDDIFTIAPEKIRDTKVMTTIVGGKVVFERK